MTRSFSLAAFALFFAASAHSEGNQTRAMLEDSALERLETSASLSDRDYDDPEEIWEARNRVFTGGTFEEKGTVDARPSRGELFTGSLKKGAKLGWAPGATASEWYQDHVIEPVAAPAREVTEGKTGAGWLKKAAVGTGSFFYILVNLPVTLASYTAGGVMGIAGGAIGGVVGLFRAAVGK